MSELTKAEFESLRSQIVTLERKQNGVRPEFQIKTS
jgi:hypothetical protein